MAILVLAGRFGGALRENLYGTTATYGLGPNLREELYPLHDCMGVILTFLKKQSLLYSRQRDTVVLVCWYLMAESKNRSSCLKRMGWP